MDAGQAGRKQQVHLTGLPEAAQMAWHREHADGEAHALVEKTVARQAPLAWMEASEKERRRATRIFQLVEGFSALPTKRAKARYAHQHGVPCRTLYHWAAKAKRAGHNAPALHLRACCEGNPERPARAPEVRELVQGIYLHETAPSGRKVIEAVREVCERKGVAAPSQATQYRWMEAIPPGMRVMARRGDKAFRDLCEPTVVRDWTQGPPNACWMGDHHNLDLHCIFPDGSIGRPWLTAWLDTRTRLVPGWHLSEGPSSDTIAMALRNGILQKEEVLACGVPERVYVDNGKDYRSKMLNGDEFHFRQTDDLPCFGLFANLGIKVHHSKPYLGRSKSLIERWFGTFAGYLKLLPGYCGNNPQNRPEGLARDVKLAKRYLEGDGEGECPLLFWYEVEEMVSRIIMAYHAKAHKGLLGRSPNAVWESLAPTVQIPHEDALEVLCMRMAVRKYGPQGLTVTFPQAPKETRRYFSVDLAEHIGRTLEIRYFPADRSRVLARHRGQTLGWIPQSLDLPGFAEEEEDRSALAERLRGAAAYRKAVREKLDALRDQGGLFAPLGVRPPTRSGKLVVLRQTTREDRDAPRAKAARELPANYEKSRAIAGFVIEQAEGHPIYPFQFMKDRAEALKNPKPAPPPDGPEPGPRPGA